jgi:hypothetical protein
MRPLRTLASAGLLVLAGCAVHAPPAVPGALPAEQERFWEGLQTLCGQAFPGRVIEAPATDTTFAGRALVMHVRECGEREIRIPFHVGEDRSRTWVVGRTPGGLRLKHDHRHPDGTPDANTDYGGDTAAPGTAVRQEFPADAFSIERVPARATQAWFLEVHPGRTFAYGLHREATGLRYRIEFDLASPVPPPPAPWGRRGVGSGNDE